MNIEKYTERARGFIQSAQTFALGQGHQQFSPLHLLKVLLEDEEGMATGLIERAGGNAKVALAETDDVVILDVPLLVEQHNAISRRLIRGES